MIDRERDPNIIKLEGDVLNQIREITSLSNSEPGDKQVRGTRVISVEEAIKELIEIEKKQHNIDKNE